MQLIRLRVIGKGSEPVPVQDRQRFGNGHQPAQVIHGQPARHARKPRRIGGKGRHSRRHAPGKGDGTKVQPFGG